MRFRTQALQKAGRTSVWSSALRTNGRCAHSTAIPSPRKVVRQPPPRGRLRRRENVRRSRRRDQPHHRRARWPRIGWLLARKSAVGRMENGRAAPGRWRVCHADRAPGGKNERLVRAYSEGRLATIARIAQAPIAGITDRLVAFVAAAKLRRRLRGDWNSTALERRLAPARFTRAPDQLTFLA